MVNLNLMNRSELIEFCQKWDKDGDYSDEILIKNGYKPLTQKQALTAAFRLLADEIIELYDSNLNITYDDITKRYGLNRTQIKKILLTDWEKN
jgi:hypothetical protein